MRVIVSPRCVADHGSQVLTDGLVERCSKTRTSQAPGTVDVVLGRPHQLLGMGRVQLTSS